MSRAFLREDAPTPEPERDGAYRVFRSTGPASPERELVNTGDDLLELVHWAETRPRGHYQLRDRDDIVLAEIG